MRQNVANYFRALSTVCIGVLLALLVGSFMGTPDNPARFRQVHAKVDAATQAGTVFRESQADAYLAIPSQPNPPFWVAVLDWHAWLLAPALILALLALRPAVLPASVFSCVAAALLYCLVAPTSAFVLLGSAAVGILGVYGLGRTKPNAISGAP
jgi:hypothetical protein